MKKQEKTAVLLFWLLLFVPGQMLFAQSDSLLVSGYKKNILKWNMSPYILWSSRDINISYERVLKPYRSFSVNAGYFELPVSGLLSDTLFMKSTSKGGATLSGDYRFYFKKRNRRFAPDGLYWAPYASMHYTYFGSDIRILDNNVITGSFSTHVNLNIFSAGVEIGYQFVIKKRLTVDLVFLGPSLSFYSAKILLSGKYQVDEENEYVEAIRDYLIGKYPFLDDLIQKGEIKTNGVTSSLGLGMRYLIQIGYRF